jgi:hypothetical protein
MPRHCIIEFTNPVTGQRQPSLIGYLMNQQGIDTDTVNEVLQQAYSEIKSNTKQWGSNNSTSDFAEPRFTDLINLFNQPKMGSENIFIVPGVLEEINQVQNFYDLKNITLNTDLNIVAAKDLIKEAQDSGISLELEVVNPEDPINERIYRAYPVNLSETNIEEVNNFIYKELNDYYTKQGMPNALPHLGNYIDVLNPSLVGMLKNVLNDPSTTQFEKDMLNSMLSVLKQFPEIKINFSKDLLYSGENTDSVIPAKYEARTNSITFYVGPLSDFNNAQFKQLLLHELTHPILFSTLNNPQTPEEKVFASEIKRIYDYYRTKNQTAAFIGDFYGFMNEHEFVAEFISNPSFRAILEQEAPEVHGSTFQSILNFFKKIFSKFLGNKGRTDSKYINDLLGSFFNNVLNSNLNTSQVYVVDDAFNYEVTDKIYNDFFRSMNRPGTDSLSRFYEGLDRLLNDEQFNWNEVYKHAVSTGIKLDRLTDSRIALENIELTEDIKSDLKISFKAVMTHLADTKMFLRSLNNSLTELNRDKSLPESELFRRAYHAKQIGEYYKDYIETFKSIMDNPSSSSPMGAFVFNIDALAKELIDGFDNVAAPAIASKFADYFWPQREALVADKTAEINRLKEILANAERAGNTKKATVTKEKIKENEDDLKRIATKENLQKAFRGVLIDKDKENTLGSRLTAFMESAALSGNLITGSLAGFIDDLYSVATNEAIALEREMKELADIYQAHQEQKGNRSFTSLGFGDAFGPVLKRVKIKEIKRVNNVLELVDRETFVFQTEMDETAYLNEHTELRHNILKLENKPNKNEQDLLELENAITKLANFEDEHLESLYTDEYHRIQNILSPAAKEARDKIIDEMRKIQINPNQGDQTDEDLDVLEDLKRQLDELENPFGKTPEQQEIAYNIQEWKKERQNANLFVYKVTQDNKTIFTDLFESKKSKVRQAQLELANLLNISEPEMSEDLMGEINQALQTTNSDRVSLAKEQLKLAEDDLRKFKRNNVVKKIKPEFYELRNDLLEGINAIQDKYITDPARQSEITELYQELFTLLKPYKNQDGEYVGSKLPPKGVEYITEDGELIEVSTSDRIKQIEDQIADIRESLQENLNMSKEDKANLKALFSQLDSIQTRETTEDYKRVVKIEQAKARTRLISKLGEKANEMSSSKLNREIIKEYRNSDWYINNHRDFKPNGSGTPLFQWRYTMPTDPAFISEQEPSFRWYTIEVNDAVNPQTGQPLYINTAVKNFRYSKRVPLKKTSTFRNSEYDRLDPVEKQVVNTVLQKQDMIENGLPSRLKLGIELPAYRKTGLESMGGKVGNLKSQITSVKHNLWEKMSGREEEDLTSKVSVIDKMSSNKSELQKYSDRIHLKYVTPIEADRMSVNFFESITSYGADAIRFKHLYKNMAYIFGTRDLVGKNLAGTTTANTVNNIIERKVNGKSKVSLTGNPILNAIGYISDKAIVGLTAKVTLSVNLPSAIKNFLAGSYSIYTQAGRFGLSPKEIAVGKAKAALHLRDFYRASVESGVETPYLQIMKYFSVMPENHLGELGKNIYRTTMDKTANYNPLKMYAFARQALEFEMRVGVAEALSKQHLIELNNGTFVPIMEAYISVGNVMVPRADIQDLAGFSAQENHFKGRLNLINSLIHGAYGAMDKAEYQRYAIGRFIMMMRNWFGYQYLSRFGSRRMSIRAGLEFEGMYRTLWNVVGYNGTYWKLLSMSGTNELLSYKEKENLKGVLFDTMGIGVIMTLANLMAQAVYGDDDEDIDNPLAYLALYNLLYLEDEISTLHPIFGPAAIAYARVQNKVSGDDFMTYYFKRYFVDPLRVSTDIVKTAIDYSPFGDQGMFDEYVPRSRSGKVMNPKRYKPDPFLEGMPDVVARTLKMLALDKSVNYVIGNQEFMYRKYEYLNPKYFINSYSKDLREVKREQRSNKLEIKAIEEQLNLIEDPDTKEVLYQKIQDLKDEIAADKEKQEVLESSYLEYLNADRK